MYFFHFSFWYLFFFLPFFLHRFHLISHIVSPCSVNYLYIHMHIHIYALCYFTHYIHTRIHTICMRTLRYSFSSPPQVYFCSERVFSFLIRIRHSVLARTQPRVRFFSFFFFVFSFFTPVPRISNRVTTANSTTTPYITPAAPSRTPRILLRPVSVPPSLSRTLVRAHYYLTQFFPSIVAS